VFSSTRAAGTAATEIFHFYMCRSEYRWLPKRRLQILLMGPKPYPKPEFGFYPASLADNAVVIGTNVLLSVGPLT
jgi:hypothetical protein